MIFFPKAGMFKSSACSLHRFLSRLLLCVTPLFAGCGVMSPAPAPMPESRLHAYVVIGENGAAWARVIAPAAADAVCPLIVVESAADRATQRMNVRAPSAAVPQRPTASDAAHSKPSLFLVLTCEWLLPPNATRASVDGIELRLPKPAPRRIVVLGDTGCRMKKADNAWQACLDNEAWPFRAVSDAAAAFAPDLVIHIGDFHYRENACPETVAGCQGSPWGYGWDTWLADFFDPAAKLLAAAPWVVARGNHEECRRAGQGWFRFLDPFPFEEKRSCNDARNDALADFSPPYAIPLAADLQMILFDSAVAGGGPLDLTRPRDARAFAAYRAQFAVVDQLAGKPGINSIFINHHPILGFGTDERRRLFKGTPALLSAMKELHPATYYPSSVNLALQGHVHIFQAINFLSDHPATFVSSAGGSQIYANLPDPFPLETAPADGVVLESIAHSNQFGFAVMDKGDNHWRISAYDQRGAIMTSCILTGSKLRCDKTGLLKH